MPETFKPEAVHLGAGSPERLVQTWVKHQYEHRSYASGLYVECAPDNTLYDQVETVRMLNTVFQVSNAYYKEANLSWNPGSATLTWPSTAVLKVQIIHGKYDFKRLQGIEYSWIGINRAHLWPNSEIMMLLAPMLRSRDGIKCELHIAVDLQDGPCQWITELIHTALSTTTTSA